jgi:hypothetical protein
MPFVILIAGVVIAFLAWTQSSGTENALGGHVALPKQPLGNEFIRGDRVVIIGLPLSGKTYLATRLTASAPRILFFDPYHDYVEKAEEVKAPPIAEISADELIENPKILNQSKFRLAIIPDEDDLAEQLDLVVRIARAAGDLILVMDEVGDYKRNATLTLEKLARNGRHNGLVPIYVSQVAMDIPRTVRRIATRVYSFRQEDIEDLDALAERYGDDYAAKVSNLPEHEYAQWNLQGFGRRVKRPQSRKSVPLQSQETTAPR